MEIQEVCKQTVLWVFLPVLEISQFFIAPPCLRHLVNGKPNVVHEVVYVIPSIRLSVSRTYSSTAANPATGRNHAVEHNVDVVGM